MGTGDYICVTVHGCAPWGFTLREGVGDSYRPLQVYQVVEGGRASIAGICEGDEVVSLNGEPCSDLSLPEAIALVEATVNCLQLLVKRCCSLTPQFDPGKTFSGVKDTSGEALESQTLHILSPGGSGPTGEYYTGDSQDEDYSGNAESDADSSQRAGDTVRTELCVPASGACRFTGAGRSGDQAGPRTGSFPPGAMVELQLSISKHTPEDPNSTSLGSALGIEGEIQAREAFQNRALLHTTTHSLYVPGPIREPLGQHGVVLSSPSLNGTVEVTMQHPAAGRGSPRLAEGAGVCENVTDAPGDEGGGRGQGAHASFTVSFGIPTEGLSPEEEQDSDSGEDVGRPSKHRARHARLRRSESLSDKQVKEAKSKCKRIAILLNTDAPNPHNKGLLMFKKHRQRSKKYTLVSYGTGESDPEREDDDSDEEDENTNKDARAIDFNLVAPTGKSALDKDVIPNAQGGSRVLTFDWDTGLLEIERKLATGDTMEQLPNTTGKGATMFAQRRQRMDEIAAEHEEMRRQGIPVEGVQAVEKHAAYQQMGERSYMQATMESQTYMDVNVHQKQQHEYQQYQEQQQYQQQYQQQQQQQYEQLHYQQQQQFQQQYQQQQQHQHQEYQQQQTRQYSSNMNGTVNHQTTEMQSSVSNQTAQPFSMEKQMSGAFSSLVIGSNQEAMGQGEQIASRDERISTPAIKSGILHDTRNRTKGKPMFNFKQAPKVSPNPELLNLLNRSDKKLDVESGTEEDYLSLGAEACNFLQSSKVKQKTPPPVAPKPVINPNSPPWSPQPELSNQELPQRAENSVPAAPAAAPESESVPAPELASEPSPPLAPQEAPVPANPPITDEPTWSSLGSQAHQRPQQEPSWGGNGPPPEPDLQPEPQVSSWAPPQTQAPVHPPPQPTMSSWASAETKPQAPAPSQSPQQLPWVTPQISHQVQAQPKQPMSSWAPAPPAQPQPQWAQPQEQAQQQPQQHWAQPQAQQQHQQQWPHEQPQNLPQPPWAQPQGQVQHQPQQNWAQPQEQSQHQPQPPWAQPQEQSQHQPQPPWAQPQEQSQHQPQPPWAQPQEQSQHQPQPPWAQPKERGQQQPQQHWAQRQDQVQQPQQTYSPQQAWTQDQAQAQPQPSWISSPQPQPPTNAWTSPQSQAQPAQPMQSQPPAHPQPLMNAWGTAPAQAQVQPPWAQKHQEQTQPPTNTWAPDQNQPRPQPPWSQPSATQSQTQQNWQQPRPQQAPQAWSPANAQPQTHTSTWGPSAQQAPVNTQNQSRVSQPSPQTWNAPQSAPHSTPPPQRMNSYTFGERSSSSPVNPMASVLSLAGGMGSALSMPAVRGKGADLFAKRQSRMEKYVVDSDTVQAATAAHQAQAAMAQATKARPASPSPSVPNSWKYSPTCRAPPTSNYNPIHSPSYPPGAIKQAHPSSPMVKAKKGKAKPAPKPLAAIDVMKHQPYQLNSSLFTYGPAVEAAEAAKANAPKPEPAPAPHSQNQPIMYEQAVQPAGPMSAPYPNNPQQLYGMPPQPAMQDGAYHHAPPNAYQPPFNNPYQQVAAGPYQHPYNPPYPQAPSSSYQPQAQAQPSNPAYQQAPHDPYQPAHSPPYQSAPQVPYQPLPPSTYVVPSFPMAAKPESVSGGSTAPKPRFMAKKSSAQVWKPTVAEKE